MLRAGQVLVSKYEVVEFLGKGGMGEVYRARDLAHNRQLVAVKKIRGEILSDVESRERFRREIESTFSIRHQNIVEGIEYIHEPDLEAYVMEYVDGGDLAALIKARPARRVAVSVLRDILSGLSMIHDAGMVHRDLKPENILLTKQLSAKISDFGAARFLGSSTLTREGLWIGTPLYIAPEYVETGESDQRGDIFSWGVLAYQLLSGQSPYHSNTKAGIIAERFNAPQDIRDLNRKLPSKLCDVVRKAMCVRLSERYQDARDILADLDAFGDEK